MAKKSKSSSRLVYSTDGGRLCPQCHRPVTGCVCGADRPVATGDGIARISRETKGRGGKAVTVISGLALDTVALKKLCKELKQRCGVGGAVKEDRIEIQGDQRELLRTELERRSFLVKFSGG